MIRTYSLELDDAMHPVLRVAEEYTYTVDDNILNTPEKVIEIMNTCFRLGVQAEEYVYAIALDQSTHILDIFRVAQGSAVSAGFNTRELLIRLLIAGATQCVIVHNHPSCARNLSLPVPSDIDRMITSQVSSVCRTVGIMLVDHIVLGGDNYYSFKELSPEDLA